MTRFCRIHRWNNKGKVEMYFFSELVKKALVWMIKLYLHDFYMESKKKLNTSWQFLNMITAHIFEMIFKEPDQILNAFYTECRTFAEVKNWIHEWHTYSAMKQKQMSNNNKNIK